MIRTKNWKYHRVACKKAKSLIHYDSHHDIHESDNIDLAIYKLLKITYSKLIWGKIVTLSIGNKGRRGGGGGGGVW